MTQPTHLPLRPRVARTAMLAAAAAGLAGCTAGPLIQPATPALHRPPMIQAGCLLPAPELFAPSGGTQFIDIQLQVQADGRATDFRVVRSSGSAALDAAFLEAARQCRYTPALARSMQPVAHEFKLRQGWGGGSGFVGVGRCFRPTLPVATIAAARARDIRVSFALPNSPGQEPDVRVEPGPDPELDALAKVATRECLKHAEAQIGLRQGTWYSVVFTLGSR